MFSALFCAAIAVPSLAHGAGRGVYEAVGRLGDVTGCFLRRQGGVTAGDVRAAIAGLEDARCDAFENKKENPPTASRGRRPDGADALGDVAIQGGSSHASCSDTSR